MEKITAFVNGNAPAWVKAFFRNYFETEIIIRNRRGSHLYNKNGFRLAPCYYNVFKEELEKAGFEVSKYYDMVSVEW